MIMACSPLVPTACPENYYCEASVFRCTSCTKLCNKGRESVDDCRIECPEVWKRMSSLKPSHTTTVTPAHSKTSRTTTVTPYPSGYNFDIVLVSSLVGVCAAIVIVFIIILSVYLCRQKKRRSGKYKENINIEQVNNSLLNPDATKMKIEENHEGPSCQISPEIDNDNSYRSLMGSIITHPSDQSDMSSFYKPRHSYQDETRIPQQMPERSSYMTDNHPPGKSMDDVNNTAPKMSHVDTQSTVPLPGRHSDPNTPTEENVMKFTKVTPHNSAHGQPENSPRATQQPSSVTLLDQTANSPRLDSVEGYGPTDMSLHLSLTSDVPTPEAEASPTDIDLRSSDTIPINVPTVATPHTSGSQPSANDSSEPFRQVMKAYDAFDANLHQMSFARGCLIGNDEFQVFTSGTRDQNDCYDRVMNIMPSDVPQHIVAVEPEEPRNPAANQHNQRQSDPNQSQNPNPNGNIQNERTHENYPHTENTCNTSEPSCNLAQVHSQTNPSV